jgi:hypothetical protein
MSRYVVYYSGRKEMYRDMAERWTRWSKSVTLTPDEIRGTSKFFHDIAVRFGLINEFREIGVIS